MVVSGGGNIFVGGGWWLWLCIYFGCWQVVVGRN